MSAKAAGLALALLFAAACTEADRLRIRAHMGDAAAQSALGDAYSDGESVPKDAAKAVEWWRKAAEQGLAKAQLNLGNMYANGEGVPKDLVQAHMWLNLAAASGEKLASDARRTAESDMTREQVAEAEKRAREWYEAHQGGKE